MTRWPVWGLVLWVGLLTGRELRAQLDPAESATAETDTLIAQLKSGDRKFIDDAVARIEAEVLRQGGKQKYLNLLLENGFAAEADAICVKGVIKYRWNTLEASHFARKRVRCLQAKQDFPAALAAAKAYYNVCLPEEFQNATRLLADCLTAAYPDDPEIANRFAKQQLAGAFGVPDAEAEKNLGPPILDSIKADGEPYRAFIEKMPAEQFGQLVGKANLLLLSDRADEAIDLIKKAIDIAPADKKAMAHMHMSRALRAKHGRSGEADAYLNEHSPKPVE